MDTKNFKPGPTGPISGPMLAGTGLTKGKNEHTDVKNDVIDTKKEDITRDESSDKRDSVHSETELREAVRMYLQYRDSLNEDTIFLEGKRLRNTLKAAGIAAVLGLSAGHATSVNGHNIQKQGQEYQQHATQLRQEANATPKEEVYSAQGTSDRVVADPVKVGKTTYIPAKTLESKDGKVETANTGHTTTHYAIYDNTQGIGRMKRDADANENVGNQLIKKGENIQKAGDGIIHGTEGAGQAALQIIGNVGAGKKIYSGTETKYTPTETTTGEPKTEEPKKSTNESSLTLEEAAYLFLKARNKS